MAETEDTLSMAVPQRESSLPARTSRRALIGTLAGAGAGTAFTRPAAAATVDPHPAWERQARGIWDREVPEQPDDPEAEEAARDAKFDEWAAVVARIADTPARTPKGIAVQIRQALFIAGDGSGMSNAEIRGLKNAAAALERMSAG